MRNLSYYRRGWNEGKLIKDSEFWKTVNGNFLDITVTEWCKLFADPKGKHHWRKVVKDHADFEVDLLAAVQATKAQYDEYVNGVRTYRDKFVAHLDDLEKIQFPQLDLVKRSLVFVYDYMLQHEDGGGWFGNFPAKAADYIARSETEADEVYK
jgi:hypothetical protein